MSLTCGDSYACYAFFEIAPVVASYFAMVLINFFSPFLQCKCIKHTRLPQWHLNFITTIVEHVFENIFKKSEGKGKVYTMFNFKAPPFIIYWLYAALVNVTGLAFIEFWDEFLLEESFDCSTDKHIACFLRDRPDQKLNCSNLLDDNVTSNSIICYKFVFRLGSALGSALGIITTFALGIYIAILFLLKVSNGSRGTKRRKQLACSFQIFAVLMLFIITNILVFFTNFHITLDNKRVHRKLLEVRWYR